MSRNIKTIRGQQVDPNPVGPECISVTKIYDWVTLTNRERTNVTIPPECLEQIEACRAEGNVITATCSEVLDSRSCDLVGAVPTDIGVPGAQIVTLAFQVQVRVEFLCNGVPLPGCNFVSSVNYVEDVILCFPEGTEINCQIYQVQCNVLLNQMLGNIVVLDVVLCPSVRVEADVALEVQARFCGPREIIPIESQEADCPYPTYPPQCPTFFPAPTTTVQGAAEYTGTATISYIEGAEAVGGVAARQVFTTTPTGELNFTALIGDECRLSESSILVEFLDTPGPTPTGTIDDERDQSFRFRATDFNQPTPVGTNGLSITGNGTFSPSRGTTENATFTLRMTDSDPNGDSVTLTITSPTAIVTIALNEATYLDLEVEVEPCNNF
ncbi:hypothetical protein [Paucisalibacillus globulus]|uniref:hypothetical protein n=1 Tax=Paucisalibacillus globulus TaxID=351095 RepID=UPI000BB86CF8|nr:hypothetical protein [Paucisalibacillus globulus]